MKTIAEQLKVKEFPFSMYDARGNHIYYETSIGYWCKYQFNEINLPIHYENSNGYWYKTEFDNERHQIYYENSDGAIEDNRPKLIKEVTMQEVEEAFGCVVKIKK